MMSLYYLMWFRWLTAVSFCIGLLIIINILSNSHETGEDPWIWIPLLLLLPVIGVPVYITYKIFKASGDRRTALQQFKADAARGAYVSRRVGSEKELRDRYYNGKGM
jgi:hypothetical protein